MFIGAILKVRTIDWRLELVMASGEVFHLCFFLKCHICIFVILIILVARLKNFHLTSKVGQLEEPLVVLQLGDGVGEVVASLFDKNIHCY